MALNVRQAASWLLRVLPLLAAAAASAQFSGLTTTHGGASVFFSSELRQRSTDQHLWPKIFRIDNTGAELVAQRDRSGTTFTNAFVLDLPQISADGRILVYRGTSGCGSGSSCFMSERHLATMLDTTSGKETTLGGNVRISRDGRFMAWYVSNNVMGAPSPTFKLIDRSSSTTVFEGDLHPEMVSIAADGTTVTVDGYGGGRMTLIRGKSAITLRDNARGAVIDDHASTVVYETTDRRRLFAIDLRSDRAQQIGPDDRESYQPTLSADGRRLAYLSTIGDMPQLFVSGVDGTDWRQLTTREDGIAEATLSGNGGVAFAVTGDGSILRIEVETGIAKTLVGPTPVVGAVWSTTPGSLTRVSGKGLANSTVIVAGLATPIVRRSAEEIVFQMPWDVPVSTNTITTPEGGDPYFEVAAPMVLSAFSPSAFPLGPRSPTGYYTPVSIHGDFNSLVTEENPARPGEVVHLYLEGGGPVTVPVATGVPNPIEPLSRITTAISVVADSQTPLEVPFIGLAPGLLGLWQMDVKLPSEWNRAFLSINIQYYSPPPNSYSNQSTVATIPMAPSGAN
jgi:uncharacterized protein (TIGR03437 family)